MNKIMTISAEGRKTKRQDSAKFSCQTIQDKLIEQKSVEEEILRLNFDATEEHLTHLVWLARMLPDEEALSGFAYTVIFFYLVTSVDSFSPWRINSDGRATLVPSWQWFLNANLFDKNPCRQGVIFNFCDLNLSGHCRQKMCNSYLIWFRILFSV